PVYEGKQRHWNISSTKFRPPTEGRNFTGISSIPVKIILKQGSSSSSSMIIMQQEHHEATEML
uniref:Uncharacterized protein n=1 Tax=Oryza brachyantha TaxID=4533 RepID=J3LS47_ORYBR